MARRYEHLLFSELDAIQRDPTRPGDDRLDAAEELRRRETERAADPHGFDLPDAPTTREQSAASDALLRVRREAEVIHLLATGPWGRGEFTGEPSRLAVQVRHENFAKHAELILAALDEIEADRGD